MKLTEEKVNKMIKAAERNGFSKESVFEKIKLNKALHNRADKVSDEYWASK